MATAPRKVYIQDRNSGKVLQYKPDSAYQVEIESEVGGLSAQLWTLTDSGVAGYIYITSIQDNNVMSAGSSSGDPLYCTPKKDNFDLSQLWILRPPNTSDDNRYFVIMNAATGLVMDVKGKDKSADTFVQVHSRNNGSNQQFFFHA